LVRRDLLAEGYRVRDAEPVRGMLAAIAGHEFDLVVMDIDAVSIGGTDAIRMLRHGSPVPIVALSARGDEDATAAALDSGADDYVRKPFGPKELLARIRNALRRRAVEQGKPTPFVSGDLEVDFLHHRVRCRGQEVQLSPRLYAVLRVLTENAGKLLTHKELLRTVWGEQCLGRVAYLRLAIRELRRKLEIDPAHPQHVVTETRVGYRLQVHKRTGPA